MRVTKRGDSALRAALGLATVPPAAHGVVPLRALARATGVPGPFLQKILLGLKRGGLVASRGGRFGGYRLARPAAQIRVGDVLRAVERRMAPMPCVERGGRRTCREASSCRLRPVWIRLRLAAEGVVDGVTLAELAR